MTTSFITDDLTKEIERQLAMAVEVCIAAAFYNLQGVKLLKKYIAETRKLKPFNINFLLDKDFHPHPAARETIIAELSSIPGSKVRVFKDEERRLHMKVYIFSAGNTVSVISGSHNATQAGLTKNIEAGLLTSDRKAVRDARNYFNKFWSKSEDVVPNVEAFYRDPAFQPAQMVRHRTTGDVGVIVNTPTPPDFRERNWYYNVWWRAAITPTEHVEEELKAIAVVSVDSTQQLESLLSQRADTQKYLKTILKKKLLTPVRDGLFAYMSSRTDIIPYQFKPLIKILASDSYRILIADEVGLGKTIEAGIIFSELKARITNFKRVLIICPTNLKTKWKDEMESRFDEYFKILVRQEFEEVVTKPDTECFGIISFDLLANDNQINLLKDTKPNWDLIIIDEAHHVRNKNKRYHAVAELVKGTTAQVMLSATPINLGIPDLMNLLLLLLPRDYRDVNNVEFGHRIQPNKYLFEATSLIDDNPKMALQSLLLMEKKCKYAGRISSQPSYKQIKMLLSENESLSVSEVIILKDDLINLNSLAHVITRTRKEDVSEGNVREVITYNVDYSDVESQVYNDIVQFTRILPSIRKGQHDVVRGASLAEMMPQRQAASCLPAAVEYLRDVVNNGCISTQEMIGEFIGDECDEEPNIVKINNISLITEATKILSRIEQLSFGLEDSKYIKLQEFIKQHVISDGFRDKVIIFTSFRRTLSYLQKRLENDFGSGCTVEIHGDIPLLERDERRQRFRDCNGPSILISTEVGSEGLDLQFASKLVNYDLPWNPSRVEQRIGRIDRYGQKAEKIMVLNFAMSGTIEDNMVARLIERIKVFSNSLGELSSVVGKVVKELRQDLLNPKLTEEQRTQKIKKYEQAIINKARSEERLEKERVKIIGQDKNFNKEFSGIQQNRKYITPEEISQIIDLYCADWSDATLHETDNPQIRILHLGEVAQFSLMKRLSSITGLNDEKRRRYLDKLGKGSIPFTVDRATAIENKTVDYLTIHNPIIAAIINQWDTDTMPVVGKFSGNIGDIPAGDYLVFTYYCEYQRQGFPTSVYLYNMAVSEIGVLSMYGDVLYHSIMSGDLAPTKYLPAMKAECLENARRSVQQNLSKIINETSSELERSREQFAQAQIEAITTATEKEINILSQRQKYEEDNRIRNQLIKLIEDKRKSLEEQVGRLQENKSDIIATPTAVGLAWCRVEVGGISNV